tara:strand:- start:3191 stop:3847 length:657 start_codon:yes stop_codon:yes gene_type:complete
MKKYMNKSNYSIFIISSFFISLILVHIFYLALINPLAFEYMSYAKINNTSPERHFSVILKDPEQKICLILFFWSTLIGFFNYYLLQEDLRIINKGNDLILSEITNEINENTSKNEIYSIMIENKFDLFQLDLSFIKYISWAIPSIGFIGTVRGIGEALSRASEAIDGDITGMTTSLGVAFNSTFVALLLSIVLMFIITRIEYMQDNLIILLRSKLLTK